jgi:hypothetical protein
MVVGDERDSEMDKAEGKARDIEDLMLVRGSLAEAKKASRSGAQLSLTG